MPFRRPASPGVPPRVLPYCYLGTIALLLHCSYVDRDPHKSSAMVLPWYYRRTKAEGRVQGEVRVVSQEGHEYC